MTWFRRTALWLGIILVSMSWRFALHLVTAPGTQLALLVSLTGIGCVVAAGAAGPRQSRRRSSMTFLAAAGAAFLISGISAGVLLRVAPGLHDINVPGWIAPALGRVSSRLGLADGLLTFWDGRGLGAIRVTFEGLGLYEIWFIAAGAGAAWLVLGTGFGANAILKAPGLIAVYALSRSVLVVALAVEFESPALIWHPVFALVSYLPLAPLLAGVLSRSAGEPALSGRRVAAVAAGGLALLAATTFPLEGMRSDSGGPETPRVLIDETHSDWEWAAEPFDTTSFGIRAEYNYHCFAACLGEAADVRVRSDSLTPKRLEGVDVLIVKTPTEAYSRPEIDAIVDFVRAGGGLFLIGDHTNLFGMTTYLNAIAERFGMRLRSDDTFDLATGGFSSHVPMGFWTHPVMRGVRGFRFLTSCTIEGGPGIEPIMLGAGLGSEDGDYGHPNFFGNISYDLADRFGVFLQAAGRRVGRGRVLLFTDSTCFSNFCMFSPGTPEVALRLLGYLARRKPGGTLAARERPPRTVLVDTTHSRASFFDYIGYTRRPVWERFEELYISVARVGMRPVAGEIADLHGAGATALAIVNPRRTFAPGEVEQVFEFVNSGGGLLVLDGVANSGSAANQLLRVFRMGTGAASVPMGDDILPALEVIGGEPLAADPAGRVCAARQTCGAGRVVVAVDSYTYSEAGLGRPLQNTYAYEASRWRYRALFGLFGEIRPPFR